MKKSIPLLWVYCLLFLLGKVFMLKKEKDFYENKTETPTQANISGGGCHIMTFFALTISFQESS